MIFLQWVYFDLSVIRVLFSLDYKLFCFARGLTHVMIIMLATPFD